MIEETPTTLRTPDGVTLEARTAGGPSSRGAVVLAHPHPLYGGDMENPVVVRAAEVCAGLGLATLRFNFRGVGHSTGLHGKGVVERVDIETALAHLRGAGTPNRRVALVGYSFGAAVAAQVAAHQPVSALEDASNQAGLGGLCLVAPPLKLDRTLPSTLAGFAGPFWILAGTRDEYCPPAALEGLQTEFPGL